MSTSSLAALDHGLSRLRTRSPEYGVELSDHAPMVIEALERLDRTPFIEPFLDMTLPKLRELGSVPEPGLVDYAPRVDEAREDLQRRSIDEVLLRWSPRFVPGLAGAAFHGLIRVAHAYRSIARRERLEPEASRELRRDELAKALAYASVRSVPLPQANEGPSGGGLDVEDALREIAPSPEALSTRSGLISTALARRVREHTTLAATAAALVLPDDPNTTLRGLRSAAVDLFLDAEYLPLNTFTLLHAVTGMDAAVTVGRALPIAEAHALARHAAHALLAMRIAFVGRFPVESSASDVAPFDAEPFDAVVERAVRSLDDHAIKFAAALSEAREDLGEARAARALARWVSGDE